MFTWGTWGFFGEGGSRYDGKLRRIIQDRIQHSMSRSTALGTYFLEFGSRFCSSTSSLHVSLFTVLVLADHSQPFHPYMPSGLQISPSPLDVFTLWYVPLHGSHIFLPSITLLICFSVVSPPGDHTGIVHRARENPPLTPPRCQSGPYRYADIPSSLSNLAKLAPQVIKIYER